MKLPDVDRLKKFKRITKTEKRLNFVKHRFPPPAAQLEITDKVEDTTYIQSVDKELSPQIENTPVYEASEGNNSCLIYFNLEYFRTSLTLNG